MKFEVKIPVVGESINEVTLGKWLKSDGELVQMDEVLCEIESEKATLELRSDKSGVLKILVKSGETVPIGHTIAEIETEGKVSTDQPPGAAKDKEEEKVRGEMEIGISEKEKLVKISPLAARLLAEAGRSVSEVQGTGASGRITKADVQRLLKQAPALPEEKSRGKKNQL